MSAARPVGLIGGIAPESTIDYVHDTYMSELVAGRFEDRTRERFEGIIRVLQERERIDGVILAGTELPLLLRESRLEGLEMLDTTALHVDAIVERMFG